MDYTLKISPRMLELLSKHLYTNIYFVLGELIANAYDADAENVYIFINSNSIKVEDDGIGMTPNEVNDKYLFVGTESRSSETNARTKARKRLRMGRKGIGKLAALSISDGFQLITVKDGIRTALYIPNQIKEDNEKLRELSENEYVVEYIEEHGTAVIMNSPKIKIPSMIETIVKNLSRIFPKVSEDFKIHIIHKKKDYLVESDEKTIMSSLVSLITIGDKYNYLGDYLPKKDFVEHEHRDEIVREIPLKKTNGEESVLPMKVNGWIGVYESTKGMKKDINEFSDNYLAIFSHNKLGQRNVLDLVGKNRMYESYIVGNLFIDSFEEPDYPDMASTNRQGYNEEDPRWKTALSIIRPLVDSIVNKRNNFQTKTKKASEIKKLNDMRRKEEELMNQVRDASNSLSKTIQGALNGSNVAANIGDEAIKQFQKTIGLKTKVDANKKKIIISQTLLDKLVSDVVYKMLLFNGVPMTDIIYSNSGDPESNIPDGDVYGYLRDFFVNSVSDEKIYVLFVTSNNIFNAKSKETIDYSWGVMMEIGATWITKKDHAIFNIEDFQPREPMNTRDKIVQMMVVSQDDNDVISISEAMCNAFVDKIINACNECGYQPKDHSTNKKELLKYIVLFDPAA